MKLSFMCLDLWCCMRERTIVIFQGRKIFDQRISQFFDGEEGLLIYR